MRLLTSYGDAGNTDRIYDKEMNLLQTVGCDMELAAAELLGRDVRRLASQPVLEQIRSLLEAEPDLERLLNQMAQTTHGDARPVIESALHSFHRQFRKLFEGK